MPTIDWRVEFFRRAFLRHAPRRYAVMLTLDQAQRVGQKYMERRGMITDTMITRHLAGAITLAAPAAVDHRAHLLPLDIDAGGMAAIRALIAAAFQQELWAFGQYCLRQGQADDIQRGYVWLPFDTLARHQHTGHFGDLILGERRIDIDQDPTGALAELYESYRENRAAGLPELPPISESTARAISSQNGDGITITRYNEDHDVEDLIQFYGARPARRRGLYFCPFHPDDHASLSVYTYRRQRYCRCFSAHSDCPLARHARNDAFNVYCIGEGIEAKEALRQLNGRD